jgi:hypothetical protein
MGQESGVFGGKGESKKEGVMILWTALGSRPSLWAQAAGSLALRSASKLTAYALSQTGIARDFLRFEKSGRSGPLVHGMAGVKPAPHATHPSIADWRRAFGAFVRHGKG